MFDRKISTVAAAATLLSLVGRWGPGYLLERQIDGWIGGASGGLPLLGSVGQTVSTYSYAVGTVELLVPLAVGVGLGVWLARRVGREEHREGLRAVAVGSLAVVTLPVVAVLVLVGGLNPADLAMALAMASNVVVVGPVFVTVAAAAGVTLETAGVFPEGGDTETDRRPDDDATATERGQTS